MIDTTTSLLSELRSRSILRRDQLAEIETTLAHLLHDPQGLARELVRRGWLTAYQINQLFRGRPENLTLGAYVLLERVGEAEMGLVYKARHRHLNRVAAVQVVREELLAQPEAVSRFYEEVQAASHLDHANVVHLYDAGPVGRTHFLAMEHVTGTDLRQLVQKNGPLPIEQACDYIRQTALGLEHGFERGLMHHALKPAFLLVTSKSEESSAGMIKIVNLGVTHLLNTTERSQASFAGHGVSVDFLSPEQAEAPRVVDVRSELYSLGCVFYFLLTGQPPFPGGSAVERLQRHRTEPAPSPMQLRPDVSPQVAELVTCLLAKRPEDRHARPRDVAQCLAAYSGHTGSRGRFAVSAPAAGIASETRVLRRPAPSLTATPVDMATLASAPIAPTAGTKRWKLIAAAVGACLFLGIMLIVVVAVGFGIARWKGKASPIAPAGAAETEVSSAAFRELETRAREGRDVPRLRDDLLAFRVASPASSDAMPAAELLARLPAPIDQLSEDSIPREERFAWQPRELVGVLGEHQPKPWLNERLLTTQPAAGLVATIAPDNTLRVWDLTSRVTRASVATRINSNCATISRDGKRLAVGSFDRFVRLIDLTAGAERWSSDINKAGIQLLAISPDREALASYSFDRIIRIFDAGSGKERASWTAHLSGVRALAFAPDGKSLVTVGYRLDPARRINLPEIKTWDVSNGALLNTIDLPMTHHVISLLFPETPDMVATAGGDAIVRFFNLQTGKEGTPITVTTGGVNQATIVPGGKLLATVGTDLAIRLWSIPDGVLQATLSGHTSQIFYFAIAADGRTATTASYDQTVRAWDLAAGTERGVISGPTGWVTSAVASPDGYTLATGHRNGAVKIWDAATGHVRLTLAGHTLAVTRLAYSADGRLLASAGHDRRIKLWDVDDGKEKDSREIPATVVDLAFAPERRGALAAMTTDQLFVWNAELKELAKPVLHEHARGRALAFAADGKSLFTTGDDDGNLRRWDVATLQMRSNQAGHRGGARALAASPDGKLLATVATVEAPIRFWALAGTEPRERKLLPGHTLPPVAMAFSSDGKMLASVADNGQILLWDVAAGRKTRDWLITGGPARSISFSPDGRHLLALNGKGVCHVLRLGLPPRQRADAR